MFEPVKIALGQFVRKWFDDLAPTTKPLVRYVSLPYADAVQMVPGRMIDAATDALNKYLRADNKDGKPSAPYVLPVTLIGLASDYTPTGRDYTRQISEGVFFRAPDDEKGRVFRVRTIAGDIRAQIVFIAQEPPTARSMAAQFLLFLDRPDSRRFLADYVYAGKVHRFPVQVESPDSPAMQVSADPAKNLCILAVDITLKCTVPIFDAPKAGEANDGLGTPGSYRDPAGYPVVTEVQANDRTITVEEDSE